MFSLKGTVGYKKTKKKAMDKSELNWLDSARVLLITVVSQGGALPALTKRKPQTISS